MGTAQQYIDTLYDEHLDGYIQILEKVNEEDVNITNIKFNGLLKAVNEMKGSKDIYITPNSFYKPQRNNNNIRQLRSLFIDLDLREQMTFEKAIEEINLKVSQGKIPQPTMTVNSGRGIHLYWVIEHAPKQAIHTWQELEDYLYHQLKPLYADFSATDCSRLLRLPETLNSRNDQLCTVIDIGGNVYSMRDLRETLLNHSEKVRQMNEEIERRKQNPQPKKNQRNYKKLTYLLNPYTLHTTRAEDLKRLVTLRNGNLKGHRNTILHMFSYWEGIYKRDDEHLLNVVKELNNQFREPLALAQVKSIVRSTRKAVELFIAYTQGLNAGEDKRLTSGMKKHGGYWYKNTTIIELLKITDQEQTHLKTIISKKEKLRRQKEQKKKDRRNSNGLTKRQQNKWDNVQAVKELYEKGYKQIQIAKELNITRQYVSKILNNQLKDVFSVLN